MSMYNYIKGDEFISSTERLQINPDKMGTTFQDYQKGKYILLDEEQVAFMEENPEASPAEVYLKRWLTDSDDHSSPYTEMYTWYNTNTTYFLVNGKRYNIFDWTKNYQEAQVYKNAGRETMLFFLGTDEYITSVDAALNLFQTVALFMIDVENIRTRHYRFIDEHPDQIDGYDYTEGVPPVPNITIENLSENAANQEE